MAEQCPLEESRQIWDSRIPGSCVGCIMQAIVEGPQDVEAVNDRVALEAKNPAFITAETFGFFNVEKSATGLERRAEWYETINPFGDEDPEGEHDVTLNILRYGFVCLWAVGPPKNGTHR